MNCSVEYNGSNDIIYLPDIIIGRSLGAMAFNYDIETPDGEIVHLTEGTRISSIQVIAGKGRDRLIDIVDVLVSEYGGIASEWQKVKGIGYVDYRDESLKADLHWYQEPTVGKVLWKIKPDKGGNLFSD